MSAYQRRKGHAFERTVAARLREVMPGADIKRGLQTQEGGKVPDVVCPVFWPECKIGKRPPIVRALAYAASNAPKGRIPIAVTKQDRQDALVTLTLDDFLDFVGEWWQTRNQ